MDNTILGTGYKWLNDPNGLRSKCADNLDAFEESLEIAYRDGFESFMTGKYQTHIQALKASEFGNSWDSSPEHRYKFHEGFKEAYNLIYA